MIIWELAQGEVWRVLHPITLSPYLRFRSCSGGRTLDTRHSTLNTLSFTPCSLCLFNLQATSKNEIYQWIPPLASFLVVPVLRYFTHPIGPQKIKIQKPKGMIFHIPEFLMFFNGLANMEESLWRSIWLPFGYLRVIYIVWLFGCHAWGPPFDLEPCRKAQPNAQHRPLSTHH